MLHEATVVSGTFTMDGTNEVKAVWDDSFQPGLIGTDKHVLAFDSIGHPWDYMSVSLETLTYTAGMSAVASLQIVSALHKEGGDWVEGDGTELDLMIDSTGTTETADLSAVGNAYGPRSVTTAISNAADPTIQLDCEGVIFKLKGDATADGTVRIRVRLSQ